MAIWIGLALTWAASAFAQKTTFLVTWQNAWFRAAPSVMAPKVAPVIQGAIYDVVGRSEDGQWLALAGPNVKAWLPAGFGEITGSLAGVPVIKTALPAAPKNANTASLPEWIVMTPRGKQLYQRAIKAGRDPRMFTIAGDSNSAWQRTLGRIAAGVYDLSPHDHLRPVVARFDPSFARVSVAVQGGAGAVDMFDPAKATSPDCRPDEGMFACELRLSRASIVFIQLGTGDKFAWREFEANMRQMIDYALDNEVLPVLMTKADDMESIQGGASFNYINDVIRKLASEYQLPLADFYVATRSLPVVPNPELPKRPFTQNGLLDEWGYYFHLSEEGFALKVLANLMMLDAITRGM
ncbi:MAG: hypothetical protein ACFLMY_02965 [Candidatus Brachytrichaceae bacterium NZ_4S206]